MENEIEALKKEVEAIEKKAEELGLDFFPMRFEICPADIIYTFGAYGMPIRFSHWSFGKAFYKMKIQYDFNLSKIYELVINSNPCYAFLLEGNSMIQQKLVIAHVYGHSDFFKNNYYFSRTNRDMLQTMAINARKIRNYESRYGQKEVEKFLDAVLAIQEHIDIHSHIKDVVHDSEQDRKYTPYDDLWTLDNKDGENIREEKNKKNKLDVPKKDVLGYIMGNCSRLEDWQRDIIGMIREEMLYFWPQIQTKIMNEGWAVYWHLNIMRRLELTEEETIEFAKIHSGIVEPSCYTLNPYFIGLKIFEDIERRKGLSKIFEVRQIDNDVSFIRNYLTDDLIEKLDLYLYEKVGQKWVITEKQPEKIREGIVNNLLNGGFPYIVVVDGDYENNGELYLKHCYEGRELDVEYLKKTLPYVYHLWGKKVYLETVLDEKKVVFSYDGVKCRKCFG